jgi:hypothetical protein
MVFLQSIFLILTVIISGYAKAEDLDSLLTGLAAPKVAPVVPGVVPVEPAVAPVVPEPIAAAPAVTPIVPGVAPVVPGVVPVEPVVAPVVPGVVPIEPKIAPVVPSVVPVEPKIIEPAVVKPIMPNVMVSPIVPHVITPEAIAPLPVGFVGAPKAVAIATPVVATAAAEPKVEATVTDVHVVATEGLDTLHIDSGGNWLEKRIWYKKAEQMFEEIRMTLQKASDIRMKFVHEVNQVGQSIDEFYETVGFQKGQIDELLQAIAMDITTEQDVRGGDLSSGERTIRLKVKAEQPQLQAISKDFKMIEDLDDQVDKTMMKAFKEIDACRALETKAWNNFKEIGLELDDKKARILYLEMENFNKNIEQKMSYLQTNLLQYLQSQLVSKVTQTIAQIKTSVQSLQTNGVQLQSALEKDAKGDFMVLQQRDEAKAQESVKPEHDAKKVVDDETKDKKTCSMSWYQQWFCTLLSYLSVIWSKIVDWTMIVLCCVQTVVCKVQEIICGWFGH